MLFTVFRAEAWRCWQEQIDLEVNQFGWGYDVTFARVCHAAVGVVDTEVVTHAAQCPAGGDCSRSYDKDKAMAHMWAWLQKSAGLRTQVQAEKMLFDVTQLTKYPGCSWPKPAGTRWRVCAAYGEPCLCNGTVVYGRRFVSDRWSAAERTTINALLYAPVKEREALGAVICGPPDFPAFNEKPAPGHQKHCLCRY